MENPMKLLPERSEVAHHQRRETGPITLPRRYLRIHRTAGRRWEIQSLLALVALTVVALAGCRRAKEDAIREYGLELAAKYLADMPESASAAVRERAAAACSKLENGIVDEGPVLVLAELSAFDDGRAFLQIVCIDEDEDLRGLRVVEEFVDSNGTRTILKEDYPVYVAWALTQIKEICAFLVTQIKEICAFLVDVRTEGQRKDEQSWKDYAIETLDDLVRKTVDDRETDYLSLRDLPEKVGLELIPPICLSVPEPNRVKVLVSAYDRAGNASEPVELEVSPRLRRVFGTVRQSR
jgi:hypothetical protein